MITSRYPCSSGGALPQSPQWSSTSLHKGSSSSYDNTPFESDAEPEFADEPPALFQFQPEQLRQEGMEEGDWNMSTMSPQASASTVIPGPPSLKDEDVNMEVSPSTSPKRDPDIPLLPSPFPHLLQLHHRQESTDSFSSTQSGVPTSQLNRLHLQQAQQGHLSEVSDPTHPATGGVIGTNTKKKRPLMTMGFRVDCEKCRMKVPGHYAHFQ
ncbi:hypothetical protein BT69DRAFT_1339154 [Atractiella rhizophila]|nr:hypothetical protein BT69DRAFT_1339154 [Atractiella rhizophila]